MGENKYATIGKRAKFFETPSDKKMKELKEILK